MPDAKRIIDGLIGHPSTRGVHPCKFLVWFLLAIFGFVRFPPGLPTHLPLLSTHSLQDVEAEPCEQIFWCVQCFEADRRRTEKKKRRYERRYGAYWRERKRERERDRKREMERESKSGSMREGSPLYREGGAMEDGVDGDVDGGGD
jgi:hypothetical protein